MNLVKYEEQENFLGRDLPSGDVQTWENFNKMINEEPDQNEISVNEAANNSLFIAVSFIQMKLDKFFIGLWRTKDFRYQVIVNEITGTITLEYFHPFAKVWITREGSASVMIQQRSVKSGGSGDISNVSDKIKNTLQKDLPHLMAACLQSAAKTIGKTFGRDLNRKADKTDYYDAMYSDIAATEAALESIDWDTVTTTTQLKQIWASNPAQHNNKSFQKKFTYHKNRINKL